MDIDTTPPASHHDVNSRPSMQLDLPPADEIMMEVDPDISLGPAVSPPDAHSLAAQTNSVSPANTLAHPQWFQPNSPTKVIDYAQPAFRPLPSPPSAIISSSDVAAWPKLKLDQLFIEWFARPDSQTWISNLLADLNGGKSSAMSFLDLPNPSARYERAHSPGRSKSPSSQGNPSFSPQQAPSSPVSKLFRTHVPFDESESPHSPPATPVAAIAVPNLKPALSVQSAISMDLGKSGTASPIALDQHNPPLNPNDSWKLTPSAENLNNTQVLPSPNEAEGPKTSTIPSLTENNPTEDTIRTTSPNPATDSRNNVNHSSVTSYHPNGGTNASGMSGASEPPSDTFAMVKKNPIEQPNSDLDTTEQASALDKHLKVDSPKSNDMPSNTAARANGELAPAEEFSGADARESTMLTVDPANSALNAHSSSVNSTKSTLPPTNPRAVAMSDVSSLKKQNTMKRKTLPRFYFPCGRDADAREKKERSAMEDFFRTHQTQNKPPGFHRGDIAELVVEVIGLPSYFASIIFNIIFEQYPRRNNDGTMKDADGNEEAWRNNPDTKMAEGENSGADMKDVTATAPDAKPSAEKPDEFITEDQVMAFYRAQCVGKSREARLFNTLLGRTPRNYLIPSDFKPLMQALLMCHQGLAFLHATPEFQQRYSETVIERIYFGCTRQHNGRLTLSDIKRCKLLDTLMVIDEEDDINRERRYFSYEHFYVLYCRFWELDANHDLQIDKEDLMRYSSHSLTARIVDRIFSGHARPLDAPQNTGYMSYTDFIWFCLSEEDKTSDTAIDYWFRCIDMDGDGIITMFDMEYFYKEQLHRMESFGHEPVQIKDILCQLLDMISPNINPPMIRRRDLKKCRLAGNFFNILFNLNKFFTIEARDPLQIRQEHATPDLTDWDRFAAIEYLRLSADEEGDEDEPWEEVGDAANPLLAGEAPF